jgi:hypothetical protein
MAISQYSESGKEIIAKWWREGEPGNQLIPFDLAVNAQIKIFENLDTPAAERIYILELLNEKYGNPVVVQI